MSTVKEPLHPLRTARYLWLGILLCALVPLYKEASYKPYIVAAMILMSKVKDPVSALMALDQGSKRKLF